MARGEEREGGYVFKAYPFIDGEVHSFVADVIDQQRYTNRLITLYDWIMRANAKGALLMPEDCLPDGVSVEDIAESWAEFNGVHAAGATGREHGNCGQVGEGDKGISKELPAPSAGHKGD